MPDRITSGGESFITCASASITASVGVPVTEKRRSSCFLSRTGVVRVSEWPAPDCSSVGATIHTSSLNLRATASSSLRPRAFTPSSLVSSIRMLRPMARGASPPQPRGARGDIAPISQHVGDFFTGTMSVLVKTLAPNYRPRLGTTDLLGCKCRESLDEFASG